MDTVLSTNLMILGAIDTLLDQMNIQKDRLETRNSLLSAIMSRFLSTLFEDESFAGYIREIAPKLQGNTDPDVVIKTANDHLMTEGIELDLVPIFRSQARAVLTEFARAAESGAPEEELVAVVETALA